ncbi:PRC-barrel domain-containing protein [Leptolyngbya sp. AN03gr2]|uniref:PRC-barrel domain-containing protein n=1 Tax=unclassified Leptolyngbya TaxID=2650499 RepID=UPI003D317CD5
MAEIVKQSELLNQTVLDQGSMQEVGQVEVMWMYPKVHRVLGFICKSGWLGKKKTAFNLEQLEAIGSNGVLVNSEPVETDAEKVKQLETLVGCEVWTDSGDQVGKIVDYLFDLQTGEIQHYLYVSDGWGGIVGSVYLLPPNYILRYGSRRAMVPKESVESFAVYRGGVQERFSKVKDLLSDEKVQVTQEVRSLAEIAREKARKLKEKARSMTEQAYEFVEEIALDETEPYVAPTSEPAPWDDWEEEPPKPRPKQEVKPPQTSSSPAADIWDDDDDWA